MGNNGVPLANEIVCSFSDPQAQMVLNNDAATNTSSQIDQIRDKFTPVNEGLGKIRAIFYSMIVWIVIVTVVMIAIAIATYRHWRRDRSENLLDSSSVRSSTESRAGCLADFENEEKKRTLTGMTNANFSPESDPMSMLPSAQIFAGSIALAHSSTTHSSLIHPRPSLGLNSATSVDETLRVFHSPIRLS